MAVRARGQGEIGRSGRTGDVGAEAGIHGDAVSHIIAGAAQVGGVQQL